MFSLSQRFQQTSNHAVSFAIWAAVFVIATFCAQLYHDNVFNLASSISNVQPHINLRSSRYYGSTNGKPKENVKIAFDLEADLTPAFNWNTKQVFVYLTATYKGTRNKEVINEVTFWDKIITDPKDAVLNVHNAKSKYSIWDLEEKLAEREFQFKLHWNIQPWIGNLVYGETTGMTTATMTDSEKKSKPSSKKNAGI
ncbi:LAMI_0G17194g1_1 [Lachancea mirantina]|uniref:Signal peptidase subunit 3 n=1 Tax=Lachancea mirantina TaxID=1230905 RepID=A0A1G4KCT7_9SACH|nr:LAMI_0G17194g1_1 [Lachancea mirantina]